MSAPPSDIDWTLLLDVRERRKRSAQTKSNRNTEIPLRSCAPHHSTSCLNMPTTDSTFCTLA